MEMIPVFRPSYGEEEVEAVRRVLASGWAGLGPETQRFEEAFGAYIGVPHALATNSCTAALHLAMIAAGVEGGEVISPSLTFVSTNHAILYAGARPVFADVEEETLTIDADAVERLITPRTRAITAVHYGGHPARMDRLREIASSRGISLIEDAAHACGAAFRGQKVGSLGDIACFSFHAVKNLATGEGGMLTFSRADLESRLRRLRWLGIDRSTYDRAGSGRTYSWSYEVEELGFKYHMNDIPAAIGLVQLAKLETMNQRRRAIAALYDEAFQQCGGIRTPVTRDGVVNATHNYVIRVDEERRQPLIDRLAQRGIAAGVHYIPNHLYALYAGDRCRLPVTERVFKTLVTLPLFPDMTQEQIERVIEAVRSFTQAGTRAATRGSGRRAAASTGV
ncbi:MAG TPA: DegT/DnrJ/EryC1/StrS family aminotransferase [Candidatus Polarisedimenticolia bacterium]|jgi:perosamine synthetase